jgi:[ribosomal protein S5]-alanine N-acetyltransferase
MKTLPTLETERLILRQFELSDQSSVCAILSDQRVTATLLDIPEPFEMHDAALWIRAGHVGIARDDLYPFAIIRREDQQLLGCIDLQITIEHRRADMAYWIGAAYWRKGYTSEAARRIVRFGFEVLNLNRIYAQCLTTNIASSGVMQKAGLKYEATLRQSTYKGGTFVDMAVYGIVRSDYAG